MSLFNNHKKRHGFTLIELLVVISIIGLLSSVVMVNLTKAKAKARDSIRIQSINQMDKALMLYYDANGSYPVSIGGRYYIMTPDITYGGGDCGYKTGNPTGDWCTLESILSQYLPSLPKDDLGGTKLDRRYVYKYDTSLKKYGLAVILEVPNELCKNDGGYYNGNTGNNTGSSGCRYEVGDLPKYCMEQFSGSNANWNYWSPNACVGGES